MADHEKCIELHGYVTEGHHVVLDMRKLSGRWLGALRTLDNNDLEGLCAHIAPALAAGDIPGGVTADALLDLPVPDLQEIVQGVTNAVKTPKSGA